MPDPTLTDEVTFISGVSPDGTLPLYSYSAWNPDTNPADYSGGYTNSAKWGANTAGTAGGTVYYYFDPTSNWTAVEKNALAAGLALWSAVANISFVLTTNATEAQITFERGTDSKASTNWDASHADGAAKTYGSILGTITSATISIDTSVAGFGPINGSFSTYGGYPLMTLLHEEGHALGLGHAGPYNSTVTESSQQYSAYDTMQWSIMSYIDPSESSAKYYSSYPVTGTYWGYSQRYANVPTTWMPLDILAVQALYGLPTSTPLSGGQVFGFNCNIAGAIKSYFDFTVNTTPIVTLWDEGTGNTLDLSGFSGTLSVVAANVNLNPGTFSSCDGLTNNIAIAFGTAIDTLILGAGSNIVTCNNDGDSIYCGAGNETITGGAGYDTIYLGAGSETIDGRGGWNSIVISGNSSQYNWTKNADGTVSFRGPNGAGSTFTHVQTFSFSDQTVRIAIAAPNDVNGDARSDILWQNDSGQVAIWTMNGFTQLGGSPVGGNPGSSWHMVGTGDFNGDGTADILWQNDNGAANIWTMNGFTQLSGSYVGGNPGTSWHIEGTGDFNGDGKSDILWQSDSGQAAIWTMNGLTQLGGSEVGVNPGAAWHIKGTGDFNGDGKSDILWQNDNGQAAIWLMDGFNVISGSTVGGNPGASWDVIGAGDFNGDGKSDILWQNDNGQAAIWTMDGLTQLSGSPVGGNPGTSWHVEAAGDYNGDGYADILWQNDNGQAAVWTMQGYTQLGGSLVGGNPGTTWHIPTGVG